VEFLRTDPSERGESDVSAHRAAGGFLKYVASEKESGHLLRGKNMDFVTLDAKVDVESVVFFDPPALEGEVEKGDQVLAPSVEGARREAGFKIMLKLSERNV
jgi:hypothetical protein